MTLAHCKTTLDQRHVFAGYWEANPSATIVFWESRIHILLWSENARSCTELFNFNFQSLEVVSRYCDPQLQVTEILSYLWNLKPSIYQFFKIESIF